MTTCKGTYISVFLDEETILNILKYIELANIPNPVIPDYIHCTLLCTESEIIDHIPIYNYPTPLVGIPMGLRVWKTRSGLNCLVLVFNCTELEDRHNELIVQQQLNHCFPDYISHVTLSYDVGDIELTELPTITSIIPQLTILGESCPTCIWCEESKICKKELQS